MRNRQVGRWLLRLVIGIVLVFAILVTASVTMVKVQAWQVERAIERFRAAPSQTRADELVTALIDNAATQEQGERILTFLLRPQVTLRLAYPAGRPAKMSVEMPFRIDDGQGRIRIELKQSIWAEERLLDTNQDTLRMLHGIPIILTAWLRPLEPGTYHAEIRHEGTVTDGGRRPTLLDRLWAGLTARLLRRSATSSPRSRQILYECRFTVPIDVQVVEEDRAERLELIADAQVGEAMRAALVVETRTEHETYSTAAGLRECRGGPNISFQALPVPRPLRCLCDCRMGGKYRTAPSVFAFVTPVTAGTGSRCATSASKNRATTLPR